MNRTAVSPRTGLSIHVCTRVTSFCALMLPTYLFLPAVNVTSEPPLLGCELALFAAAALRKPCGVVHISITRSSTAAGCGCAAGGALGAAPAFGGRGPAGVPLHAFSGRLSA